MKFLAHITLYVCMGTERKTFRYNATTIFTETDIQESLSLIKQLTFEFSTRNQIKKPPSY